MQNSTQDHSHQPLGGKDNQHRVETDREGEVFFDHPKASIQRRKASRTTWLVRASISTWLPISQS